MVFLELGSLISSSLEWKQRGPAGKRVFGLQKTPASLRGAENQKMVSDSERLRKETVAICDTFRPGQRSEARARRKGRKPPMAAKGRKEQQREEKDKKEIWMNLARLGVWCPPFLVQQVVILVPKVVIHRLAQGESWNVGYSSAIIGLQFRVRGVPSGP